MIVRIMLGLKGTLSVFGIIFPATISVFNGFLFIQFFQGIPKEYEEAARIDGASTLDIFFRVILPLSKPIVATVAVFCFIGVWNDYLWPHTLLTKVEVMPIMVVLPTLNTSTSTYSIPWELVLSGCTVITLPLIVVFLIFQEQFMSSVTIGAVKE